MDNKWRIFFINHDYQKLISGLLIINISKAIEIAQKYNLISRNELTNKQQGLKIRIGQDISDASEVMRLKVNLIDPDRYNNYEANIFRIPSLALEKAKMLNRPRTELDVLRSFKFRFKEIKPLFDTIKHARNVSAHLLETRDEVGWNVNVPSAILRFIEVSVSLPDQIETIEKVKKECFDIISYYINPQSNNNEEEDEEKSAEPQVHKKNSGNIIKNILYKVENVEKQTNTIFEIVNQKKKNSTINEDNEIFNDDDDDLEDDEEETYPVEKLLTRDTLRQELEALSTINKKKFQDEITSPMFNILQTPVISEIIKYLPDTIEDMKKLPDIGWRIQSQREIMEKQIDFLENKIKDILKRVNKDII